MGRRVIFTGGTDVAKLKTVKQSVPHKFWGRLPGGLCEPETQMGGQVVARRQIVPSSCHCWPSTDGVRPHAAKPCPPENQSGRDSRGFAGRSDNRQTMQAFVLVKGPAFAVRVSKQRPMTGQQPKGFISLPRRVFNVFKTWCHAMPRR